MGKIIIDGKEYTSRTIDALELDGIKSTDIKIPSITGENGVVVELNINVNIDSLGGEATPQVQSIENEVQIESIEGTDKIEPIENEETIQSKSWVRRIIDSIKRMFKS